MSYVNPPSDISAGEDDHKGGLFGKLKEKTKRASSKIKSKVAKRHGDDPHADPVEEEDEEEYEDTPHTTTPVTNPYTSTPLTTPGSHATSYDDAPASSKPSAFDAFEAPAAPASSYSPHSDVAAGNLPHDVNKYDAKIPEGIVKPRGFDTVGDYPSEPTPSPHGSTPSPYSSGLSSDVAAGTNVDDSDSKVPQGILQPNYSSQPAYEEKPSVTDQGKGALAGALGYADKGDDYSDRGYDKPSSDYPGSATESAYQTKDTVKDKAADLNNATDDSETYTQKAANAPYYAKDKVAETLGWDQPSTGPTTTEKVKNTLGANQPSTGPSVVDQAKDYVGSAVDTTKDQAYRAKDAAAGYAGYAGDRTNDHATDSPADTTRDYAYGAKDATQSKAADLNNATDDSETYTQKAANTAYAAKDAVAGTLGLNRPSSTTDTPRDYAYGAKDATQSKAADLNNATDDSETYTQKAANTAYAAKDAVAGTLGLNRPSSTTDTPRDYAYGAKDATQSKAADLNNATDDSETYTQKAANTAYAAKDAVAGTLGLNQPSSTANTPRDYAYGAKDATQSKAADLNNATDDSETYTQKAANTAAAAKDTAAQTLGLNQPSTGPSLLDQAKGYFGAAKNTTADNTQRAADTTKDYADSAAYNTREGLNQPSTGPSLLDQAKGYLGVSAAKTADTTQGAADTTNDYAQSATDTSKDYSGSATNTAKDYAGSAYDTSAQYAQTAKEKAAENAAIARDKAAETAAAAQAKTVEVTTPGPEEKALSEKITEALSKLPFQAKDTAAATAQSAAQTATATAQSAAQSTAAAAHEEAHKDTVLGKLSGYLGFGKQPVHHDTTPTTETVAATSPHDVPSSGPTQ